MLKEREVMLQVTRDDSQTNLFRSGGKIRRPRSVGQYRLQPTNSSNRLNVVVPPTTLKVPIKVDPEWHTQHPQSTTNTQSPFTTTFFNVQTGIDVCGLETPPTTPLPPETPSAIGSSVNPWTKTPADTNNKTVDQSDGAFAAEALRLHNSLRSRHGAPDLVLDPSLTKFAQRWADHLASTGKFHHCPDNKYGENLYAQWAASTKSVCPADRAVESWYEESRNYNYKCEPTSMSVGHFTQLVWRDTKRMGIARAKTKDGKRTMIVAHYDPPGNFIGQYVQNVGPPMPAQK